MFVNDIDLKQVFAPGVVAQDLQSMPALPATILDTYYPIGVRQQWPLAAIPIEEITATIGTVPVVHRGAPSVNIGGDDAAFKTIQPDGFDMNTFVKATELNDLKTLFAMGGLNNGIDPVAIWRQAKEDKLRRIARYSTDALACQSLSGKISYPMKLEGGAYATYEVTFGTILSYTIATSWNTAQLGLAAILLNLLGISMKLQENGYGSNIRWEIGSTVFSTLAAIVTALPNDSRVQAQLTPQGIMIGGFLLNLMMGGYKDPVTGATTPYLGANKIRAIDMAAPFKLWYLALDDIDANLQPFPFFINPVKVSDPSGWKLIGKTKPLPCPVTKAICEATAIF